MPIVSIFFISILFFCRWYEEEKYDKLLLSGIYTALAISQKTLAVFIGLAMLGMCITKYGHQFLLKKELWGFAMIPPATYSKWSEMIANTMIISPRTSKEN